MDLLSVGECSWLCSPASLQSVLCRVNLGLKQVYVLMSNGHVHMWRMHDEKSPTLVCVWDNLTPNHKDLALSMALMPRGEMDSKLAEMQGQSAATCPK